MSRMSNHKIHINESLDTSRIVDMISGQLSLFKFQSSPENIRLVWLYLLDSIENDIALSVESLRDLGLLIKERSNDVSETPEVQGS